VRLNKPPYVGEYWRAGGDFAELDQGLDSARKDLATLPGDWSWLAEPISDADAYAEVNDVRWGVCDPSAHEHTT
jgi:hypothetical protein